MKKLISIVSIICVIACLFTFAACDPTATGGDWWTTTGELKKDEDGKVVFEKVTLKLTTVVSGTDRAAFMQMVEEFNALYEDKISIEVNALYQDQFDATVPKQIADDSNSPDFIMSHQHEHRRYLDRKYIQPFDEAMEKSGITINMSDYASKIAQYASLGTEHTYGIPCDAQSSVVLYNKTLLGSNPLPTNRAELLSLCAKIKSENPSVTPIAMSTSHASFVDYVFPTAILQNGGSLFKSDLHADWESNEQNRTAYMNAIASIREFVTKGYSVTKRELESVHTDFKSDKALFLITNPWEVSDILADYATDHGNMPLETVKSERIGATGIAKWFAKDASSENADKIFSYSHFFAITKNVKDINKKAAICEFVKWFTQNAGIGARWAEAGHITMSNVINNSDVYKNNDFVKNYINQFYPDINKLESMGTTPYYSYLTTNLKEIITRALENATDTSDRTLIKTYQDRYNGNVDF